MKDALFRAADDRIAVEKTRRFILALGGMLNAGACKNGQNLKFVAARCDMLF
jgi:hypothetical protein